MTAAQALVTLAGAGLIVAVNYYFFRAGGPVSAAVPARRGLQRVTVVVNGGYDPSDLQVRPGVPVRIEFERKDSGSCTDEVVLADFGVRAFLAPRRTTAIQFTPTRPGTYDLVCGMGMRHGKVVVAE